MSRAQSSKIERTCETCGDHFLAWPHEVEDGHARYCSRACFHAAPVAPRPPRANTKVKCSCLACGKQFLIKACEVRRGGGKFCCCDCYYESRPVSLWRQFLRHIEPPNGEGCMLWVGTTLANGYGVIASRQPKRRRRYMIHRFAFEAAYGPIPDGMKVLHQCDHRNCANPLHLFLGTQADNMADKVAKGRQTKGESCNLAKLTSESVRAIRRRYHAGGVTQKQLAEEYGISISNICAILARRSWKHLD